MKKISFILLLITLPLLCLASGLFTTGFLKTLKNGSSAANPGTSCKTIKTNYSSSGDGVYWIDPNGGSISDAFQVYCAMTTDGGGWTLVMKISEAGDNVSGESLGYDSVYWSNTTSLNDTVSYLNLTDRSKNVKTKAFDMLAGDQIRYIAGGVQTDILTFASARTVKNMLEATDSTYNEIGIKTTTSSLSTRWICGFMIDVTNVNDGRYCYNYFGWTHSFKARLGCINKGNLNNYPTKTGSCNDDALILDRTWFVGGKLAWFSQSGNNEAYYCAVDKGFVRYNGGAGCGATVNSIGSTDYGTDKRWIDIWIK